MDMCKSSLIMSSISMSYYFTLRSLYLAHRGNDNSDVILWCYFLENKTIKAYFCMSSLHTTAV